MATSSNIKSYNFLSFKTGLIFVLGLYVYGLTSFTPHAWIMAIPLEILFIKMILSSSFGKKSTTPWMICVMLATLRVMVILFGTPWLMDSFKMMYPDTGFFGGLLACYLIGYLICLGVFFTYIPLKIIKRTRQPVLQYSAFLLLMIIWEYGVFLWPASAWLSLGQQDYTVKIFYLLGHEGTKIAFAILKSFVLFAMYRGVFGYWRSVGIVTAVTVMLILIALIPPAPHYSSDKAISFSLVQKGEYSVFGQPIMRAKEIVDSLKDELNANPADIVVWSENFFAAPEPIVDELLKGIAKDIPAQHIAGSTGFTQNGYRSTVDSVIGDKIQRQYKGTAFPVGEYIPFLDFWKSFGLFSKDRINLETQQDPTIFDVQKYENIKFIGLVCLDAFNPWLIAHRIAVMRGQTSQFFLVEIYNETLFGTERAAKQHLGLMRIMAASFRLPMIHSGQAGQAAVINADGSVSSEMPYNESGILKGVLFFE